MSIGEKLKELRTRMKKTLKEQSETFGVSINSVYRWEHDLAIPRKSMLEKIADYYGVPLDQLFQGGEAVVAQEDVVRDGEILQSEHSIEHQLLSMFRKLSRRNQYRSLGYIERVCIEDIGEIK